MRQCALRSRHIWTLFSISAPRSLSSQKVLQLVNISEFSPPVDGEEIPLETEREYTLSYGATAKHDEHQGSWGEQQSPLCHPSCPPSCPPYLHTPPGTPSGWGWSLWRSYSGLQPSWDCCSWLLLQLSRLVLGWLVLSWRPSLASSSLLARRGRASVGDKITTLQNWVDLLFLSG